MDRPASPAKTGRRRFLTGLGAAGATGAVLLARVGGQTGAPGAGAPGEAPARDGGYRETAHVRRVYAAARDGDRAGRK